MPALKLTPPPPTPPDTAIVLSPRDVAAMLGLSKEGAEALMDSGQLRCVDVGTRGKRHRRTSEAWVRAFLAGSRQAD